ncbi:MAG: chemotaxis protein CheA [Pseudomonadota bacterium]
MDQMEEIRETFFLECEELLEAMEAGLLSMNSGEADAETVNAVFRAVHSIKGGAGAFGLESLVRFAHSFETTLDEVRAARLVASEPVMRTLLKSGDVLADLVRASQANDEIDDAAHADVLAELTAHIGKEECAAEDEDATDDFVPMTIDVGDDNADADEAETSGASIAETQDSGEGLEAFEADAQDDGQQRYRIDFRPFPELYSRGNETFLLLRALTTFGEAEIQCNTDDLPLLGEVDPEGAYLSWTVLLTTESSEEDVAATFEFVQGDCELGIKLLGGGATQTQAQAQAPDMGAPGDSTVEPTAQSASSDDPLAEIPATSSTEAQAEQNDAAPDPAAKPTPPEPPAPKPASKPAAGKTAAKEAGGGPKPTVRVELDRVDRLINLVGELVINQAMLSECVMEASDNHNSNVATGLEEFKQLTREIQESVMAIRAQPVKSLFQRMSRIVREASDATGKSVELHVEGETTEVDKTVIERLADPLTHMIRNAVDHGLETPDKREANGKSARGAVLLTAAHRSGRVVIEVGDDGAGINRERVKQIAIDKGLIPEDAELTNSEIDNLLFLPGFSTASEVSDLSGRGVGMDVVKRAIQALGGRISVASTPGEGTTFSISLPLTLAVLDGMVVDVAGQTLVVPISAVIETLQPNEADLHNVCADGPTVRIRGTFVPIVDVGAQLGYRNPKSDFHDQVILLVETDDGVGTALAVDSIHDQRQVVIKGLESNYGQVRGIAAATILGDGRIALILDAEALVSNAGGAIAPAEQPLELAS